MNAELRQAILEHVRKRDHVSFAELLHEFGSRFNLKGSRALAPESYPTILYWAGMSEEYCETIRELTAHDGPLVKEPCPLLVYLIDGATLNLPLVKQPIAYKSDHWLPVVLRPREKCEEAELKGRAKRA